MAQGRRGGGESTGSITDALVAARQRVRQAVDAVGPELADLLLDVCCFLKRLDDVKWAMLEEWTRTKKAPKHAAWMHEKELSGAAESLTA